MTDRRLLILAALTLLTGVGAGAFGAHGLKPIISAHLISVWQTAVLYQLVHGLGMLLLACLGARFSSALMSKAGVLMFAGVVIFSGSLYILALTGVTWLGAITPLGGLAFIAAWGMVAVAAYRLPQ